MGEASAGLSAIRRPATARVILPCPAKWEVAVTRFPPNRQIYLGSLCFLIVMSFSRFCVFVSLRVNRVANKIGLLNHKTLIKSMGKKRWERQREKLS